jgi:hypothetical protein
VFGFVTGYKAAGRGHHAPPRQGAVAAGEQRADGPSCAWEAGFERDLAVRHDIAGRNRANDGLGSRRETRSFRRRGEGR